MKSNPEPITAETIESIAVQILAMAVAKSDAAAAAALLNALAADMEAFRKMSVGDEEPATTYAAVEGAP